MGEVYFYEHHDGWEDLNYVTDHELSDIVRFCPLCEDWDKPRGRIGSLEDLSEIVAEYSIFEDRGEFVDCFEELREKYYEYADPAYIRPATDKNDLMVGLFFFVDGHFSFAGCKLSDAEEYGDFLVYPKSHMEVWDGYKYLKFRRDRTEVDFDYYPRGRVVYRRTDDTFGIYHDKCVTDRMNRISDAYKDYKYELALDEHYCCHACNPSYYM